MNVRRLKTNDGFQSTHSASTHSDDDNESPRVSLSENFSSALPPHLFSGTGSTNTPARRSCGILRNRDDSSSSRPPSRESSVARSVSSADSFANETEREGSVPPLPNNLQNEFGWESQQIPLSKGGGKRRIPRRASLSAIPTHQSERSLNNRVAPRVSANNTLVPTSSDKTMAKKPRRRMARRSSMSDVVSSDDDAPILSRTSSMRIKKTCLNHVSTAPTAAPSNDGFFSRVRTKMKRRSSMGDSPATSGDESYSLPQMEHSKAARRSSLSDAPITTSAEKAVPRRGILRRGSLDNITDTPSNDFSMTYRVPSKANRRSSLSDVPMSSTSDHSMSYRVPSKATRRSSLSDVPMSSLSDGSSHYRSDGSAHYRIPSKAARRSSLSDVPESSMSFRPTRRSSLSDKPKEMSFRVRSKAALVPETSSDDNSISLRSTRRSSLSDKPKDTSYRVRSRAMRRSSLSDVPKSSRNDFSASGRFPSKCARRSSLSDAFPSRDMLTPLPSQKSILRRSSIGTETPKSTVSDGALSYRNQRTSFSGMSGPPLYDNNGLMGYSVPLKGNSGSNSVSGRNDTSVSTLEHSPKSTSNRLARRRVVRSTHSASNYYSNRSMHNSSLSSFHYELENQNYHSCNEYDESGESNEEGYQSVYHRGRAGRSVYLSESDDDSYDSDGGSTTRHLDEMENSTKTGNSDINSIDGSWSIHNLAADQYQSDLDAASNPFPDRSRSGRRVSSIRIPVASLDLSNSTQQTYNREESAKLLCMEGDNWDAESQESFHDEDEAYDTPGQWELDNDDDMGSLPSRALMMTASRQMCNSEHSISLTGPGNMQRQGSEHSISLTGQRTGRLRRKMYKQSSEMSITIGNRREMFKQQGSEHSISLFGGSVGSDNGSVSDESDGAILDNEIFQDALMQYAESTPPTFRRRNSSGDYSISLSGNGEEEYDASQKSIRFGRRCSLTSIHGSGIDASIRSRGAISTISEDENLREEMDFYNHSANLLYSDNHKFGDSDSEDSFYSSSEEYSDSDDSNDETKRVKEGLLWGIGGVAVGAVIGWVSKAFRKQSEADGIDMDDIDTLGQSFAHSALDDSVNFTGTDQLLAYASMGGDGGASGEILVGAFHASGTFETTVIAAATSAAPTTTTAATAAAATTAAAQTMAVTAAGNIGGIAATTATAISQAALLTGTGLGAGLSGVVSIGGAAGTGVLAALGLTGGGASTAAVMGSAIGAMAIAGSTYYSATAPSWSNKTITTMQFASGPCPHPDPDNQTGTIHFSIDVSGMEGTDQAWGWMPFSDGKSNSNSSGEVLKDLWEELFISQYNNITDNGCNEIFERRVSNATLVSSIHTGTSEGSAFLDTEWEVNVLCWEKCPTEPVFGTEFERRLEPIADSSVSDLEMTGDDSDGSDEHKSFVSMMDFRVFFESEVHAAATAAGWEKPNGRRGKPRPNKIQESKPIEEKEEVKSVEENGGKGVGKTDEEKAVQQEVEEKPAQGKEKERERFASNSPYVARTSPPTLKPTPSPSAKPTFTTQPSTSPSGSPTIPPSLLPSDSPSGSPTATITDSPTGWPTESPTISPSQSPSVSQTEIPTEAPTDSPSEQPSERQSISTSDFPSTEMPTESPTFSKEMMPATEISTESPTGSPTIVPTETSRPSHPQGVSPVDDPSDNQTTNSVPSLGPSPSSHPTQIDFPTQSPSDHPSVATRSSGSPTGNPIDSSVVPSSLELTLPPSASPSDVPSLSPTLPPSASPSDVPSLSPTSLPSASPSDVPSLSPSENNTPDDHLSTSTKPSGSSSSNPSKSPSSSPGDSSGDASPSQSPSGSPSVSHSRSPSAYASTIPSSNPSGSPSASPSDGPSGSASSNPSFDPSSSPTASSGGSASDAPSEHPTASDAPSVEPTTSANSSDPPSFSPSDSPSGRPSSSSSSSDQSRVGYDGSSSGTGKACCSLKLDECFSCPSTGDDEDEPDGKPPPVNVVVVVTEESCVERCGGFPPGTLFFLAEGPPEKGSCLPRWSDGCHLEDRDCCGPATCQKQPGSSAHRCLAPGDAF